jgi:membrane protein YqaA with SNARE-associated domain
MDTQKPLNHTVASPQTSAKKGWVQRLLARAQSPMFPAIMAVVAALDYVLFVVPLAPLTVGAAAAAPKRWWKMALAIVFGSFVGSMIFFLLISHFGTSFLDSVSPHMREGAFWLKMEGWVGQYGIWALLFVSFAPTVDHPIIAVAAITKMPTVEVAVALLIGKTLKYFLYSWLGAYAPETLKKLKIIKS